MNIIAIVNNKGGVGKTTVSRILAEYYSKVKHEKVLAIDMDPQANFSNRFIRMVIDEYQPEGKIPPVHPDYDPNDPEDADWDGISSIAGIFFGESVIPYPTDIENLEILPAHSSKLLLAESVTREEVVDKVYNQLSKFLHLEEVQQGYDKIIIDTAPSKGPLTISAVRAATDIIIPSLMEPQTMEGIYGMMHLWKTESVRRDDDQPLNLIGILANLFDKRTNLHRNLLDELRKDIPNQVLNSILSRRVLFSEVDSQDAVPPSIFDYPNSNPAKIEVLDVCKEIDSKILEEVHG